MSQFLRSLAAGAVWAAIGFAAAIPLLIWGSDKAPEFYGAFTAAIVAAIAVILGAYYQSELMRRRDDEAARREQIAEATDLFLWLEFMAEIKGRARVAARLSPMLGTLVAPVLYDTFLAVDRIYRFRGADPKTKFGLKQIEQHIFVTSRRIAKLEEAQRAVEGFLEKRGMPPIILDEQP